MEKSITISEDFYSVQGEGPSSGIPAYFIRLRDCNLTCGASWRKLSEIKNAGEGNTDSGSFKGDLHEEGKATWTCDTLPVWAFGHKKPLHYLIDRWDGQEILYKVAMGQIHLIWTGGEPTIPKNAKSIVDFMEYWNDYTRSNDMPNWLYNEIETNGTMVISDELSKYITQINCSAKLANSGMEEHRRIVPEAINSIMQHPNYNFKFVVSTEDDIREAFRDYINPYRIPIEYVCMMPGLDNQEDFHERTQFVLEMAKKYGFRGLTRLHVSAWNQTTGC